MPTKADREHMKRVAALGCIVCKNDGFEDTPAQVHHIRTGYGRAQRAPDTETIPLCHVHHQVGDGSPRYGSRIGYHHNPLAFQQRYGTELELLAQTRRELGIDG